MFSKKVLKQLFEWELFQSKIIADDLLICKTLTEVFFQAEVVIDSIFYLHGGCLTRLLI